MKRFYILAACVLCACVNNSQPDQPAGADFTYDRIAPLMFTFYNQSNGCTSYRWDFGDGMWSQGEDAAHTYESTGTYTVTLTGTTESGYKHVHQETIEVTEPAVYMAGVTYYRIPYDGRYYKVVIKDDNLLPSSFDFQTQYTPLLDQGYLPYIYEFNQPRLLQSPASHDYYTIEVIRTTNAANTSNDVSCMKQQLKSSEILKYLPEHVLQTASGATAVGIIMNYRY